MKALFIYIFICVSLLAQAQSQLQKYNPGDAINTKSQEYAPVISADGGILIFTSRKIPPKAESRKAVLSMEMVYISLFDSASGNWSKAEPLEKQINEPGRHNSAIALSNDGQKMLLYRDDISGNGDIYESVLKGNHWSRPLNMGKPICSKYHESSASIAPDGNTIYFVSDRPGGFGGRDIWVCRKGADGKYAEAINIGKVLNSVYDEDGVFIHPDGRTIFFCSNRPGGFGGFDLYRSEKIQGKWTEPVNLGPEINTSGDEMYYVSDASGRNIFISSAGDGSIGMQDIFIIRKNQSYDTLVGRAPSLSLLKGIITDASDKHPLEALIEIIDNSSGEKITELSSNSTSGKYLVSLPSGIDYGIRVSASGYLFYSQNIHFSDTSGYHEINHSIELQKLEPGKKVILKNIFYAFNKTELSKESIAELEHLILLLKKNPEIHIEIASHTDDIGSDEYNLKLSAGRAESVVKYLTEHGIHPKRLVAKGYGEAEPLLPNNSPENQAINRRTEFIILSEK